MRKCRKILTAFVAGTALLAGMERPRVSAQDQPKEQPELGGPITATTQYNILIGSGFLCDGDNSAACPAVARASDGETIEMTGAGTLGLTRNTVTAAGAFIERTFP